MNVYKQSFILGMQKTMQYKYNFFIGMFKFIFPLCIQYFIWSSIFKNLPESAEVFGYTYSKILLYSIFACITTSIISANFIWEINSDIKQGGLSKYLVKPINYLYYQLSCFIGEKIASSFLSIFLSIGIFIFINIKFQNSFDMYQVFLYYATLLLAIILNFIMYYSICSLGFWLKDASSAIYIVTVIGNIISGGIFPLSIFPKNIQFVLKALPFSYVNYFPVSVLTGTVQGFTIVFGITMQCLWIVFFFIISCFLWKLGLKNYISVGG